MADAKAEHEIPPLHKSMILAYGMIVAMTVAVEFLPIPVFVHMMVVALCTIHLGCYGSVHHSQTEDAEKMQTKDAYMFPVMGSCVLFSLYLVYKFVPKEYVTLVIKAYAFFFGVLILGSKISHVVSALCMKNTSTLITSTYSFTFPTIPVLNPAKERKEGEVDPNIVTFNQLDVVCLIPAAAVGVWYLISNHWAASNIFAIAFSIQGIEMMGLGSTFNGCVLLSLLFVYDIFWVFFTDVMVSVAKNFDAPIKLLFPRPDRELKPSMLGLGDIVIPGIFIALMLRFDLSRGQSLHGTVKLHLPYYWSQMVLYFCGLSTTLSIMYAFNAAQPALLYLVPACLGAAFVTAAKRKEVKQLWSYSEEEEGKPEDTKDQ